MLPFTPELDPGPGCAVRRPDPRSPIPAAPRLRALRARPLPPERSEHNPWHRGPEGPMDAIRPSVPKAQAPAGIQESAADAPRPRSRPYRQPSRPQGRINSNKKRAAVSCSSFCSYSSTGYTLTCLLSLPRRSKAILPSAVAKSVSSLPILTFRPGWRWVPL